MSVLVLFIRASSFRDVKAALLVRNVPRFARTASVTIEDTVAADHPAAGASASGTLHRRLSQRRQTGQSGHHGPTQDARSRLSPEWRLTPFALVNPYAGTFGPETITPEKSPLPFGPSSRSGLCLADFPFAQVRRCAPPP